jgi:carboxylesterase type B
MQNSEVETNAGRVRGFARNGIHVFKGIPYGAAIGKRTVLSTQNKAFNAQFQFAQLFPLVR